VIEAMLKAEFDLIDDEECEVLALEENRSDHRVDIH
jgi:hypothetical protein